MRRYAGRVLIFFLFIGLFMAVGKAEAERPQLLLRSYVETSRPYITLKELVINQNVLAPLDAAIQDLPVLLLNNREKQHFTRNEIERRFRTLRLPVSSLRVRIPRGGIDIKRIHRVDPVRVAQKFKETIRAQFGSLGNVRIHELKILGNTLVPSSSYHISALPPSRLQKTMRITMKIRGDSWERTIFVRGKIEIENRVLVARKTIRKGEFIDAGNTTLVGKDTTRLRGSYLTCLAQGLHRVARRTIPMGRVITRENITEPVLIRRGEVVTVKVQTPNILITTLAIARQAGRLGDIIRVENIQSKKTIYAKVASRHLVTVEF